MPFPRHRYRERWYYPLSKIGEFYVLNKRNGLTGNHLSVGESNLSPQLHERANCWDSVRPGPPFLTGGGMFINKLTTQVGVRGGSRIESKPLTTGIPSSVQRKPGDVCVRVYSGSFSNPVTSSFGNHGTLEGTPDPELYNELNPDDLLHLGNRAYNKLRPKVEEAGLAQTLAEWRSMPGMLHTTSSGFHDAWRHLGGDMSSNLMTPKKVASQFLNVSFGWQPFIKDMKASYDVLSEFDSYVDRIRDKNGSWMKRTRREDIVTSEEVVHQSAITSNGCTPSLPLEFLVPGGCSQTITRQKMTSVWYTGTFKYYRPEFDYAKKMHPAYRRVQQLITALGLRVSPSVVYKVTPWTWLVDWFVNIGDYVQRVEDMASDSIVSKEFYLMRHSRVRYEYRKVFKTYDGQTLDLRWYRTVESKRRGSAESPFHFATTPGGLSTRQIAILVALGINYA